MSRQMDKPRTRAESRINDESRIGEVVISTLQPSGEGRVRAVVDAVLPVVDGGRFAVKTIAGHSFEVTVHAFGDGTDAVRVLLLWRAESDANSEEIEMSPLGNDVWTASFTPPRPGRYFYSAAAG